MAALSGHGSAMRRVRGRAKGGSEGRGGRLMPTERVGRGVPRYFAAGGPRLRRREESGPAARRSRRSERLPEGLPPGAYSAYRSAGGPTDELNVRPAHPPDPTSGGRTGAGWPGQIPYRPAAPWMMPKGRSGTPRSPRSGLDDWLLMDGGSTHLRYFGKTGNSSAPGPGPAAPGRPVAVTPRSGRARSRRWRRSCRRRCTTLSGGASPVATPCGDAFRSRPSAPRRT